MDDKAWLMQAVPAMRVVDTVYYFYPRLLPVVRIFFKILLSNCFFFQTEVDGGSDDELPTPARCSYENLNNQHAYLLGKQLFLCKF